MPRLAVGAWGSQDVYCPFWTLLCDLLYFLGERSVWAPVWGLALHWFLLHTLSPFVVLQKPYEVIPVVILVVRTLRSEGQGNLSRLPSASVPSWDWAQGQFFPRHLLFPSWTPTLNCKSPSGLPARVEVGTITMEFKHYLFICLWRLCWWLRPDEKQHYNDNN